MIIKLDQTLLSYISHRKYTFNINGATNVAVKGIDDKRQITDTFAVSAVGDFLLMELIYTGYTKRCPQTFDFLCDFIITFTKKHCFNMEKAIEYFEKIIFPFFQKTTGKHHYPKEQMSLVVMDTFKRQGFEIVV